MNRIGVLHITDTLDLGGYERVAVNLANHLPRDRYRNYLCTTRRDGPLGAFLAPDVERLLLARRRTLDLAAVARLVAFIRARRIRILHAHGASLFIARIAAACSPRPALIWHAHFGRVAALDRSAWPYRLAVRGAAGVIAVNQTLLEWSRRRLGASEARSWYIPNLVSEPRTDEPPADLPGVPGFRIVSVANLRPEKDHLNLLRAFAAAARQVPAAQLLLVGAAPDPAYRARLLAAAAELGIERRVALLGQRTDVASILRASDIGVLSSSYEGLPMALLEYGMQGLPVVATSVGQCPEVLDEGRAGILVPPKDPDGLAEGLISLLQSPERRARFGKRLRQHVGGLYSPHAVIGRISEVYSTVLGLEKSTERPGVAAEKFSPVVGK